jgi:peptidoglycan/LPS O-acetylase OafA/YrhL
VAVVLSHWPRLALPAFVLVAPVVPLGFDPFPRHFGLYWLFRSPFMWWGYFLLGWLAAHHAEAITAGSARRLRRVGGAAALVFGAIAAVCLVPGSWRGLVWEPIVVANYAFVVGAFLLGRGRAPSVLVRWLSDASYPIYLYHFFFTSAVRDGLAHWGAFAGPAAFVAGLVGSVGVVVGGRRLLGPWARTLLG